MTKVGIISDTHGLLRPEAVDALKGSDFIVHAGDIGKGEIIEALSTIAPVTAVHGNIDKGETRALYPHDAVLQADGCFIYVLHIIDELKIDPQAAGGGLRALTQAFHGKKGWCAVPESGERRTETVFPAGDGCDADD